MDQQECMRRAVCVFLACVTWFAQAEQAVDSYVRDGMVVGLGTGRTASYAVRHLAKLLAAGTLRDVVGVATSVATQRLMHEVGIPSRDLDADTHIDVAIDGADAFDGDFNLIKGGGGALFREKLVELAAEKLVIVVDASKRAVGHLLEAFRVPVEVVKFGHSATMQRVVKRLQPLIRSWSQRRNADGSFYETDNSNVIMDIEFSATDLGRLEAELRSVHGVVCTGLFLGMASAVVVAHPNGVVEVLT